MFSLSRILHSSNLFSWWDDFHYLTSSFTTLGVCCCYVKYNNMAIYTTYSSRIDNNHQKTKHSNWMEWDVCGNILLGVLCISEKCCLLIFQSYSLGRMLLFHFFVGQRWVFFFYLFPSKLFASYMSCGITEWESRV